MDVAKIGNTFIVLFLFVEARRILMYMLQDHRTSRIAS